MADDQEKQGQTKQDAQFRAVVKRLLDTPPMHKKGKPAQKARRSAPKEKQR